MIEIELLHIDGGPSWNIAWAQLGKALVTMDLVATVHVFNVRHLTEGERQGFAGSPTIKVNGRDLEGYDGPPVMACQRYLGNDGRGWPSQAELRQPLRPAARD